MNRIVAFLITTITTLAACGDSSEKTKPDGPPSNQLDPAKCGAFAQSMANAAATCGSPLPGGAQAMIETWCKKGVTVADACGGNPGGGLDCFATPDATDWVCQLGEPYPACNGDLGAALGAYCLMASGNPSCGSGIHCDFDVDCSGPSKCNSATHQCVQKAAYCIGLPCAFDVDCPDAEKCNGAEHACVGR
jgi:hypothetical protein